MECVGVFRPRFDLYISAEVKEAAESRFVAVFAGPEEGVTIVVLDVMEVEVRVEEGVEAVGAED